MKLREVFPQGHGFVLAFEYMLSDLSEVIRNSEQTLTEVHTVAFMKWPGYVLLFYKHEFSLCDRPKSRATP